MKSENEFLHYKGIYPKDGRIELEAPVVFACEKSPAHKLADFGNILPYNNCLIDRSGRQFVCFHEECAEYSACFKNEATDDFFDFQAMHFHPDDKMRLCESVFPDILKYMEAIPDKDHADYRFTFNHRYIRKDGSIAQFLQEGTLSISDDNHLPVLKLRVFTEIGDFKTDETMILSVFRFLPNQGYQKVWSKVYDNNHNQQLSPREMEIIRLCLEGLSSKMIANRLNLSIHTVKNHKRNCMEKTLTHNITELINLCIRRHWL